MYSDGIIPSAEEKGKMIEDRLSGHPAIAGIRRAGLALGLDLVNQTMRASLTQAALEQGVIIDWYLFKPATFRIAPPLTITEEEIDIACSKLLVALDSI